MAAQRNGTASCRRHLHGDAVGEGGTGTGERSGAGRKRGGERDDEGHADEVAP